MEGLSPSSVVTRSDMDDTVAFMSSREVWKVLSAWRMVERSEVAVFAGGCSPARLRAMLSTESVRMSDMLMEDAAMSGEEGVEDAAGTDVENAAAAVAAAAARWEFLVVKDGGSLEVDSVSGSGVENSSDIMVVTPSNVATLLLSDISHAFGNAFWEGVVQGPLSLADWCRGGLSSETSNTGDAGASSSADQVGRGTPGGESITGSRGVGSATSTMTGSTPEPVTPPQLGSAFVSSPAGSSVSSVAGGVANPAAVPQGGPGRGKGVGSSSAKAVPRQQCHVSSAMSAVPCQQCHVSNSAMSAVPRQQCHVRSAMSAVPCHQCHISKSATSAVPRKQCHICLSHLATVHGVDVADLKDKISWEELTRLWKKRFIVDDAPTLAINRLFAMTQGNTATHDWLTEWQKIAATPDLELPFSHLRREFYNRSCATFLALGDREQFATFAEIIDKAREIIKTNRAAAHEKSAWQPTYVEKVKTGPRPQHVVAVQSDNIVEDSATTQASREGDQVAAVQPRSNNKSRGNGKAKTASLVGNGQPTPWVKFHLTEAEYKWRGRYVPTPLMDAGVEVVDLQKIDREFKTQRYDDIDAPLLYVRIQIGEATCNALINCGASRNYMSQDFMVRVGLGPRVRRKSQPTQVTLADGHTHKSIDRCIDDVPVYFAPHASEAVSFDILDTKFDMILGMSWLQREDHPVNFYRRSVHVRDRNGVLVPCTVAPPHPSINCHVVSAASMRASIIRDDIEEMGVCFLHALPPHDASSTDSSSDPRITELLDAYGDVFESPHGVVSDPPIRHEIILEDGAVPPRWIRPSSSAYGAPVLFVRKKNKDLRLWIDYLKLNAQTIRNVGPLPRIDDLLERMGGAKFFSKPDLKSGYHQLEIRQEDSYKIAFKTRYGHFEWLVVPFGLTNAPATFQAAMTTEFRHMLNRFVLIYLDNILVYSRSLDEHVEHLRIVLERLRQAKYKANCDKCEFARQELEYLGHYVTPQGICPLADKIEPLRLWPETLQGICPLADKIEPLRAISGLFPRQPQAGAAAAAPDSLRHWQEQPSGLPRPAVRRQAKKYIGSSHALHGYQEDSLKTSPGTLRFWEKAPLEPYAPPKPVIYYVLCQALEPLLVATGEFFHELSTVYETCRLGTHLPAQLASGMQKVGVTCPPGVVAVPVQRSGEESDNESVLTPPTYGSSFGAIAVMERFNKEEYRESLRNVCNCLQLSTVSATPKRDHEHDPCVVVYVVCPSTEPDVILDTTIDVCQYLAHVEWLEPMQLLSASRIGRKSPSSVAEEMAKGRKDCLPLASSSGVSSARVAVQMLTVEVVMRCGTPCAGTLDTMKEVAFSVYTKARRQPRRLPAKFQGVSSFFYRNFQLQSRASQQKLMSSLGGCSMGMQQQPAQPQGQQQVSQHRIPTSSAVKQHVTSTGQSLQGIQPSGQLFSCSGPAMTGSTSVWKDCGSRSGLSEERFGGVNSCEASEDQGGRDRSGDTDWKGVVPPRRLGIAAEEFSRLPAVDKGTLQTQVECKGSLRLLYEPLFILAESGTTALGLVRPSVAAGLNREAGRGSRGLPDSSEGLLTADGPGEGAGASGGADTPGRQGGDLTSTAIPTPNMHCCYKWTDSGRWLVSVWTDVRGELLDVLVLPVEAGLVAVEDDGEGFFSTDFSVGAGRNPDHRSFHRKILHMDQEKRTQQLCMLFRLLLEQGLELLAMADEAGGKKPRDIVISKIGYMMTEERDGWESAICGLGDDEGWPLKRVITQKDSLVDGASTAGNQAGTVRVRHQKGRGSGMEVPASALDQGVGHNRTQMYVSSVAAASVSTIRNRGMSGVSWGAVDRPGHSGTTSMSTATHSSMGSGRPGSSVGTSGANSSGPAGNSPQDPQEKKGRLKWVQSISLVSFCVERSMQVVWSSEAGSGTGASIPTASQLRSSAINAGQAIASIGITPVKSLAQGAYLMVPSHSLHFLAPRAQAMSSVPGAFNEPWGRQASSAVPAASALVISSVSSSPLSNPMSKGATEEWPLNLRVSLMSHHVPAVDPLLPDSPGITGRAGTRFAATATTAVGADPGMSMGGGSSTDGLGKASTRGIVRSKGEEELGDVRAEQDSVMKLEARQLVEAIAADMYALSWLTLSPIFPSRRSVLPIHGAIAQRLARILTYMDEEYNPPKQQT
ncbi:hypothetical protein CBR_g38308 [Chara braunii]|uniref:Mediator of RNA polymerase II transcription subunit 13 n=1 Tax=Chara braunii TaxID=69332 RepID=A0A388LPU5_CHABU|nr:hypothetical protein CBR_g38308 [Chara braunii]|eukprot:GBG84337.1 hypothetical protein CBR_g38308 [Chara braunii]